MQLLDKIGIQNNKYFKSFNIELYLYFVNDECEIVNLHMLSMQIEIKSTLKQNYLVTFQINFHNFPCPYFSFYPAPKQLEKPLIFFCLQVYIYFQVKDRCVVYLHSLQLII